MRKTKILAITTAAAMLAGSLALAACGSGVDLPVGSLPQGDTISNGGFVVQKGEYAYFINGVESADSPNTYGKPVKGSLMRIKTADLDKKENTAEMIVPSLMVAGDHDAGIFIYGDRVYFATPTNVRNTSGVIENTFLDFKSAKLDGTDVTYYFRVENNSAKYRFVQAEENGDVFVVYEDSSTLHSYNTASGKDTVLAEGVEEYVFSSSDKSDPYIYYVMGVQERIDTSSPQSLKYKQVYRVRADATEAPYTYEFDPDFLKDNDVPYVNLGTIVLDGVGSLGDPTIFTHDLKEGVTPETSNGYTYELLSYTEDGLYFTRTAVSHTDSPAEDGWLYFLSASKLGTDWNSVSGNSVTKNGNTGALDVVAMPKNTSKANENAIFYLDADGGHHYLYVADNNIYRADVRKDGSGEILNDGRGNETASGNQTGTLIAKNVSSATLTGRYEDTASGYGYVYYTASGSVERAVYNGKGRDYDDLAFDGEDHSNFKPVKVYNIQHVTSDWYNYEVVDGRVFFVDGESFGSSSYTYVSCVSLRGEGGKLLTNSELEALNEKYNAVMDSEDGLLHTLTDDGESDLSNAIKYYFYTGSTELFEENLKEAKEADEDGAEDTLYTLEAQQRFRDFAEGKGDAEGLGDARTLSYFVTKIGKWTAEDEEAYSNYWKNSVLLSVSSSTEESENLPGWAWALIGVGLAVVVAGAGVGGYFLYKKFGKKKTAEEKPELMAVDTTDDREVDVYASGEPEAVTEPMEESEIPEDPDGSLTSPEETEPAEEPTAPVEEPAPVEEAAPAAPEAPAEENKE